MGEKARTFGAMLAILCALLAVGVCWLRHGVDRKRRCEGSQHVGAGELRCEWYDFGYKFGMTLGMT